jgi:WD40 repeat protein
VAVNRTGTLVATGCDDHLVRLWNADTGALLEVFRGHTRWIFSVVFSPDGKTLASGSEDGTIIRWSVEHTRMIKAVLLERQYEGMNLTGVTGLTDTQKATLIALGAVELPELPTRANPR